MRDTLTIAIEGKAGQGVAPLGDLLAQVLTKARYNFLTYQTYHSRIGDGRDAFTARISLEELGAPEEGADLVLSLDADAGGIGCPRPGGLWLTAAPTAHQDLKDPTVLSVPYENLGPERQRNFIALGLITAALDVPYDLVGVLVDLYFKEKSEEPLAALKSGFEWAAPKFGGHYRTKATSNSGLRMLVDGQTALALGLAVGGVNFCAWHPRSPAGSLALNLAAWGASAGLLVERAEDEIAAVNLALGASFAGAPAVVATSSGGLSVMGEGLSLASTTETPIVIVVMQCPGLAARTEQTGLNLALHAGHGEFRRVILAPSSAEECFHLGLRAAQLAEENRGPVFVLSDQFLADSRRAVKPFDFGSLPAPVNPAQKRREYENAPEAGPDGHSPRPLPGLSDQLALIENQTHDDFGHTRNMRQADRLLAEILNPDYQGETDPEILLVTWGSTKGASLAALGALLAKGRRSGLLHFNQLSPLRPDNWLPRLMSAGRVFFIESNATGQFAQLVRRETGFKPHGLITRRDGRALTPDYILKRLEAANV